MNLLKEYEMENKSSLFLRMEIVTLISLLFLLVILAGCSKEEPEIIPVELHLERDVLEVHACHSENCKVPARLTDKIRIFNGEGEYRIESKSEYLIYQSPSGNYESKYKVADVLKVTVEGKQIIVEYISPDIKVEFVYFTIYDEKGNYANFRVIDSIWYTLV